MSCECEFVKSVNADCGVVVSHLCTLQGLGLFKYSRSFKTSVTLLDDKPACRIDWYVASSASEETHCRLVRLDVGVKRCVVSVVDPHSTVSNTNACVVPSTFPMTKNATYTFDNSNLADVVDVVDVELSV